MLDNTYRFVIDLFLYLILGTFSGILAGLFGIGGGIIVIPAFFYIFSTLGVNDQILAHMVLGTSLGVIVFSSIASTFSHHSRDGVKWRLIKIIAPSICLGSAFGGITAAALSSSTLQWLVAIFLVISAIQMIFEFPPPRKNPRTSLVGPIIAGSGIGWLSGIFGIGGGIFSVTYFYHRGLQMKQAIGSSAACGIPIAIAGSISYMLVGNGNINLPNQSFGFVYLPAACIVGLASAFTAPVGAKIAHRMKQRKLRIGFAVIVMFMGINLLVR